MVTDFLSITDVTAQGLTQVLDNADNFRQGHGSGTPLKGKNVAMLFEKPSLRTKVSFDTGIHDLGGHAVYLGQDEVGLGGRESVEDVAKVLGRYVSIIVARVFTHETLERMANATSVPVVNALSDYEHPCQAVADLLTIRQHHGRLEGVVVAFVGDANNVSRSLALGCAMTGASFRLAAPTGYEFGAPDAEAVRAVFRDHGNAEGFAMLTSPDEAVVGADVVYTDVWTSMGQEDESPMRREAFAGYQVNEALMAKAGPNAIFMHDLPAHYGEEVAPGMLDHKQSVVFDQSENRLHAQKAILELLISSN
jgi:ornithine carbamoyltransferase